MRALLPYLALYKRHKWMLKREKASFPRPRRFYNNNRKMQVHGQQTGMWYYRGGCLSLSGSGKTQVPEMRRPHSGQEMQMGDYYVRQLRGSAPLINDPLLTQYINSLGMRLYFAS